MRTKHLYAALMIFGTSLGFAQDATKETTTQAAEMLQSARPDAPAAVAEAPQNGTKQEPVKQEPAKKEDKKEKPAPAAAPAPAPAPEAADDKSDSKPGSTQKMAITEQGIKNKKKSSAAATATPATPATPPAAEEPKK